MENITSHLCRFLADLSYEDLPESVIEQTKLFIADYYAACYAGVRINRQLNNAVLPLMLADGGREESTVLFSGQKLPAGNAAFLNALYAHGADMDDGSRKAAGHIAAHVMSAVFALAEAEQATWKQVLTAINAGYEVFNRVVGAAQPSLYGRGFHSTGIGGGIACAAACAKLLGLDEGGIYNAISLAAIQSSGLILIDESGQGCKPINPANAARTGLLSARLAARGVESSRNPLESKKGWFNAFCDAVDEDLLWEGLGKTFTISESYLKLYPACRHTHCCIDGALTLRQKLLDAGLNQEDVDSLDVIIYPSAIRSAGTILYPKNADEVKFSIHYCIAAALTEGSFGLDSLEPGKRDFSRLIPRIALIPEPSMEDRKAGIRGARLTLRCTNGQVFEETVLIPKGEAKIPLLWPDIEEKLRQCAGSLLSEEALRSGLAALHAAAPESPFTHCFR